MAPGVIRPFRKVFTNPFFSEEKAPSDPDKNRHDVFTFKLKTADADNPIEAAEHTHLNAGTKVKIPAGTHVVDDSYFIFVSARLQAKEADAASAGTKLLIKVAILFAVGDQMQRAGLRSYFKDSGDSVLITCPGTESKPAWGWGIDSTMIDKLFAAAGMKAIDWKIHVIAAYSTGYRGMQGSILNGTIPLTDLKRVIFYDCLYIADDYQTGFQTQDAVTKVMAVTPRPQLIIYEATSGGTIRYGAANKRPPDSLAINEPGQVLINLKKQSSIQSAFSYARLLDEAIIDGFFKASDVPYLATLLPLPKRGTLVSDPAAMPASATGKELLSAWGTRKATAIAKLQRADAAACVFNHKLMGWFPIRFAGNTLETDTTAAMLHDYFLPEFAGEFLVPA